jgi:protein SCO1
MRAHLFAVAMLAAVVSGCGTPQPEHRFQLHGQVLAIAPTRQEATIKHDDIVGFMEAMTMPFKIRGARLPDDIVPGDLINATLVVLSDDAYLTDVKKVGSAPIPPADKPAQPAVDLLQPGDEVPDAPFVDQDGRSRAFATFRGSIVLLTFTYTRCPLPNFCPLMDRHFATIQKSVKTDQRWRGSPPIRLVTVSFDPANDTPAVLKKHAEEVGADAGIWTFLTGERVTIETFGGRFALSVTRDDQGNITHNLRTALIDPNGRVVKLYSGNDWVPEEVLRDLDTMAHAG